MLNKMLYTIPAEKHSFDEIRGILNNHPEVKFVSLVGIDIGGYATDEKIPIARMVEDMENFFLRGVQTDGSSVVLPVIATLNNAKVDIIPDLSVNWFVDYNYDYVDEETGLPVGTLRIPSILIHNDKTEVGSRSILKKAANVLEQKVLNLLKESPEILKTVGIDHYSNIEAIEITAATELEFWVKTPDDRADREQLTTSQVLKEQYWKRTIGSVRTALEKSLITMERYGFGVEMGHKEVGGIRAKLGNSGEYDHIMEQLEIDWEYSTALQACDNVLSIKHIIKDIFRMHGLEVSFLAKPVTNVAGNGEHTHFGLRARLHDGKYVNLFSPVNLTSEFMSPIGFGALMGILKNYEIINPFVTSSNDALNRLKPGFEAPVCIVTSLGLAPSVPSRNRTVLIGLIRENNNPFATRFELRSPNPKSNPYLVLATCCLAMLEGIEVAIKSGKTSKELENILSKEMGEEVLYLEKARVYRSEKDVFKEYTEEERRKLFGETPETVWENICALDKYKDKVKVLTRDGVFDEITLLSYKEAILAQWAMELMNRIVHNNMDIVRECKKCQQDFECTDLDNKNWSNIQRMRVYLGQDTLRNKSLLTRIKDALKNNDYETASTLQVEMQLKIQELIDAYLEYKKNLL